MPFFSKLFLFALRDRPAVQHLLCWSRGTVQTCFQVQCAAHKTSSSPELPFLRGDCRRRGQEHPWGQRGVPRAEGNRKSWHPALRKNGYCCKSHLLQANFPPAWPVLHGGEGDQTLPGLGAHPSHTCNVQVEMKKPVPDHHALPKTYTGPWTA